MYYYVISVSCYNAPMNCFHYFEEVFLIHWGIFANFRRESKIAQGLIADRILLEHVRAVRIFSICQVCRGFVVYFYLCRKITL